MWTCNAYVYNVPKKSLLSSINIVTIILLRFAKDTRKYGVENYRTFCCWFGTFCCSKLTQISFESCHIETLYLIHLIVDGVQLKLSVPECSNAFSVFFLSNINVHLLMCLMITDSCKESEHCVWSHQALVIMISSLQYGSLLFSFSDSVLVEWHVPFYCIDSMRFICLPCLKWSVHSNWWVM